MTTVRPARLSDLGAIAEIYNEAIRTTTATFDTEPKTIAQQQRWFASHGGRYPILVAELDGQVVGWACLSRWSERPAYNDTAETSFYVKSDHRGKGIGRELKEAIVEQGRRLGFHSLIARVAEGSQASLHLNETAGFRQVGVLKDVGRKFGRLLDVHVMQLIFDTSVRPDELVRKTGKKGKRENGLSVYHCSGSTSLHGENVPFCAAGSAVCWGVFVVSRATAAWGQ